MMSAFFVLYRDASKETSRAFSRSMMIWPLPVAILIALQLAWIPLAMLGIVGGLIHFVLEAYLYGAYLYLVGEALTRRTMLSPTDIKDALGRNMREVMSLLFVVWILQLALQMAVSNQQISTSVFFVTLLAVSILFNPGPEIIHQERSGGGMDILAQSFRWMSNNGPEWLPNLVVTAGVLFALNGAGKTWVVLIAAGLMLHPWMLFRGALYRALGSGSRRSRAWRSRF